MAALIWNSIGDCAYSAKCQVPNLLSGLEPNMKVLLNKSNLAVRGPYTEQALYLSPYTEQAIYLEKVMFLVFNDRGYLS